MTVPPGGRWRTVFVIGFSFFVPTQKTNVSVLFAVNIDDTKYEHVVGGILSCVSLIINTSSPSSFGRTRHCTDDEILHKNDSGTSQK